jgi:pilus assembly protein Flp/PilA
MINALSTMLRDDEGATMVEYGVIVALIAAVCIIAVGVLGGAVNTAFGKVNTAMGQ